VDNESLMNNLTIAHDHANCLASALSKICDHFESTREVIGACVFSNLWTDARNIADKTLEIAQYLESRKANP
jgi:hypothetical protein